MAAGRLEKSAALAAQRVMLGGEPQTPAPETPMRPLPSREELLSKLAACERRLDESNAALAALREQHACDLQRLQQWQNELDTLQAEARKHGHEQGRESGERVAREALQDQAVAWCEALEQLARQHDELREAVTRQLADMAMAAIARIMGSQLVDVTVVQQGITHIVRESGELGPLKIFVAPRHYEQLSELEQVRLGALRGQPVELFPDNRVEYGGCLLDTANGIVDGRYEIQLANLREIVQGYCG